MKDILILAFLITSLTTFSQTLSLNTNKTYAVVVGISDYQDPQIPDLRFADQDALAFAGFLQSPAGGSLDKDHLKVLVNEQATGAQIAITLDWLWEVVKENDRVIIYFSGHGDVEKRSITQPGYLLGWDAPSRVYMAGGALNVRDLNDVISTLSIQNKAKVILITDACRAGKLSGSGIGGSQATAANLAKQYANEIKILSCQPNEYSIEGEQWGGGRGAFSYHLLDGITGMADGNGDNTVNLKEIGRYLEDYVTPEVAPQKQNPMVIGDREEKLTNVFPEILEQLKEGKKGQLQLFTSTISRGIEDDVLAAADSTIVDMYWAFQETINTQHFLTPENACADFYYEKLSKEPQLERLHSSMRRNYAAALQDDAQQVLNKLLKSDAAENQKTLASINAEYVTYPENLRRAAELLGSSHYMYNELMARSYWFEGYLVDGSRCQCFNVKNAIKVIPFYMKALEYQPEMPHAWLQLAALYGIQKHEFDTAEYYAQLAIDAVPGWVLVYDWMGNALLNKANHCNSKDKRLFLDKAKYWLDKGLGIDSNSVLLLNNLAYLHNINGDYEKEQELLDRSFQLEPMSYTLFFKGQGYVNWGKLEEAEKAFQKAIKMDSSLVTEGYGLSELYRKMGKYEAAIDLIKKGIALYPDNAYLHTELGSVYKASNDIASAIKAFKKAMELGAESSKVWDLVHIYITEGDSSNLSKIVELFDYMQKHGANMYTAQNYQGMAYFKMGQSEKAKELILQAQEISPEWPGSYISLYIYYLELGEEEKAREQFKMAMRLNYRYTGAYWLKWFIGFWPWIGDEHTYFNKALDWFPDYNLLYFEYARVLSLAGQVQEAFDVLEKGLEKGYNDLSTLQNENDLKPLREQTANWEQLINKYFP